MANGIDSRFTNVLPTPVMVEEKTSAWDAIVPLAQMAMQQKARQDSLNLEYRKISIEDDKLKQRATEASDQKQYQSDTLDAQDKANRELNEIRSRQADTAATQAATDALKQKSDAKYQVMTNFTSTIALLPPEDRYKEILLNPEYMKYTNTNRVEVMKKMNDHEDYKDTVMQASGIQTSNNPFKIKTMMRSLQDGPMNENSRKTYQNLALQLPKAEQYQKDLYEVDTKEILSLYPGYAEALKSIADNFKQPITGSSPQDMASQALNMRSTGVIPANQLSSFIEQSDKVTREYANKYRIAKGIGTYEDPNIPDSFIGPTQRTTLSELEITPDDYAFTDERFELIEKVQGDSPEMFEKWLNSGEEYSFKDLEADISAGSLKIEVDEPSVGEEVDEPQGISAQPSILPSIPGDVKQAALEDADIASKSAQTKKEVSKQPEASYEAGIGWIDSQGGEATPSQIKEAIAFNKKNEESKGLTDHQQRKIRTNLSRIKNIQAKNYSEGEKARRIRAIQDVILSIDPNYDFKS